MSNLSDELKRQLKLKNKSVDDVVSGCDGKSISRSQVYKWINSDQTKINELQLNAISKAISDDPHLHAKLLAAHLEDERFGVAKNMVQIQILSRDELNDLPKAQTKGEKALVFLAEERIKSKSVDDLIIELAKALGDV